MDTLLHNAVEKLCNVMEKLCNVMVKLCNVTENYAMLTLSKQVD